MLFGVLPYAALGTAVVGLAVRALLSRPSPRELERRLRTVRGLLRGSVSWRLGILGVLLGHLVGLLVPRGVLWWNQVPLRLVILEVTGFGLGVLAAVGLALIVLAPRFSGRLGPLSISDTVLLTLVATSVVSGLGLAVLHRWASSWYATVIVPYLRSLVLLAPEVGWMADLPFLVKLHAVSAFALVGILPFTRLAVLVHVPIRAVQRYLATRRAAGLRSVETP